MTLSPNAISSWASNAAATVSTRCAKSPVGQILDDLATGIEEGKKPLVRLPQNPSPQDGRDTGVVATLMFTGAHSVGGPRGIPVQMFKPWSAPRSERCQASRSASCRRFALGQSHSATQAAISRADRDRVTNTRIHCNVRTRRALRLPFAVFRTLRWINSNERRCGLICYRGASLPVPCDPAIARTEVGDHELPCGLAAQEDDFRF